MITAKTAICDDIAVIKLELRLASYLLSDYLRIERRKVMDNRLCRHTVVCRFNELVRDILDEKLVFLRVYDRVWLSGRFASILDEKAYLKSIRCHAYLATRVGSAQQ